MRLSCVNRVTGALDELYYEGTLWDMSFGVVVSTWDGGETRQMNVTRGPLGATTSGYLLKKDEMKQKNYEARGSSRNTKFGNPISEN